MPKFRVGTSPCSAACEKTRSGAAGNSCCSECSSASVPSVDLLSITRISSAGTVCSIAATTHARIVDSSLYAGITIDTVGAGVVMC